jgi:hypothetical protein
MRGQMKRGLAILGIVVFSLMLIALPRGMEQNPPPPGDYAYLVGQLAGMVLIVGFLFYSVRWYLKLSGHTYKVGRQAWASILFWYSLLGVLLGLTLTRVSGVFGVGAAILWVFVALACWKWRKRLRRVESGTVASSVST